MTLTTDSRPRHPEKAHKPDNPIQSKPAWIRVKAPTSATYHETRKIIREKQSPHGVRGSGLSQHRGMLVQKARHHYDHGRALHAGLHRPGSRARSTPSSRPMSAPPWPASGLRMS